MSDTRALVYLGTSHFFWSCYPVFHLLWVILSKSFCGGNQHHTHRPRLLERPLKSPPEVHPATIWEGQVLLPQRMKNNWWFWELPVVHLLTGPNFQRHCLHPILKNHPLQCVSVLIDQRNLLLLKIEVCVVLQPLAFAYANWTVVR